MALRVLERPQHVKSRCKALLRRPAQTAVDQRGLKPFVIRLRQGIVEKIEIVLGLRDETTERVEISGPITEGDTLLVGAAQGITVGTPVKVSTPSDKPPAKN